MVRLAAFLSLSVHVHPTQTSKVRKGFSAPCDHRPHDLVARPAKSPTRFEEFDTVRVIRFSEPSRHRYGADSPILPV